MLDLTMIDLGKKLPLTQMEAVLIDYVYTMHSWYPELETALKQQTVQALRLQLAPIITNKDGGTLNLDLDSVKELLIRIPPIFRIGLTDVGFSLKIKLYRLLDNKEAIDDPKVANNASSDNSTDQNDPNSATTNSTATESWGAF